MGTGAAVCRKSQHSYRQFLGPCDERVYGGAPISFAQQGQFMNRNLSATLILSALSMILAGCAGPAIPRAGSGGSDVKSSRPAPRPSTRPPARPPARPVATPPPIVRPVQNNLLIGHSADALARSYGSPRIDVTEGTGRKMQFAGSSCVIDVYFYPPTAGAAPVATHVDARSPDGRDVDVDRCAQSLRRR